MHHPLRAGLLVVGLFSLLYCSNVAPPSANGSIVGSWKLGDPQATQSGEHTQAVQLPNEVKLSIASTSGTIMIDGQPVQVPLTATVTVFDSLGLEVVADFPHPPMHVPFTPEELRPLDLRITSARVVSGCIDPVVRHESSMIRLHPSGAVEVLPMQ